MFFPPLRHGEGPLGPVAIPHEPTHPHRKPPTLQPKMATTDCALRVECGALRRFKSGTKMSAGSPKRRETAHSKIAALQSKMAALGYGVWSAALCAALNQVPK